MPYSLNASGIKCTTAPAIKAPAEKLTKQSSNFLSNFSFRDIVIIPIKDIRLTKITLAIVYKLALSISNTLNFLIYKGFVAEILYHCSRTFTSLLLHLL